MTNRKRQAGEVLRRLIKENYKTQQEFAEDYGMDPRTVSRYINEEKLKDTDVIQELADFFQVDFLDFFKEA